MGLFDKKFCDICGEQIKGLGSVFGTCKLEDGNICKNCASKLSPFFTGKKKTTVEDIKAQLAYREQNKEVLKTVKPTLIFGNNFKVYVDTNSSKFFATRNSDYISENPDVINFTDVSSVQIDIQENKDEIFREDNEGNKISYNPPRYEVEYEFNITINVNNPYFSEIRFELSDDNRPESEFTDLYREYERQANKLKEVLESGGNNALGFDDKTMNQNNVAQATPVIDANSNQATNWICNNCGQANEGKFCQGCGTPKQTEWFCQNCGTKNIGKFCQNCGQAKL